MRALIFFFLLFGLASIGNTQSSDDYCICEEVDAGYNFFITNEEYQSNVASDPLSTAFNFGESWSAPPSFFAPGRIAPQPEQSMPVPVAETAPEIPNEIFSYQEAPLEDEAESRPIEQEALEVPEMETVQSSNSDEELSAGSPAAPRARNKRNSNQRKIRPQRKSNYDKSRIKRKRKQGRLKNKRQKSIKKYRGKCPTF